MNGKEYLLVQMAMIEVGKKLEGLDFDGFLRYNAVAEAQLPELETKLSTEHCSRVRANLASIKSLAEAFKHVQDEFERVKSSVVRNTAAFIRAES